MATKFIAGDATTTRRKRVARPTGKRVDIGKVVSDMHDRYPTVMAHLAE
ncbi:hypothetical protein SAMN03159338_1480 [Sphingomonas sp. NFR04]|nr:hypothetical protein [Sphingomonas sp. NFR04]SFJ47090.1 hypothetical protein SAMN03159338_1480 [Sphingomonas sp. NFR04]